MTTTYPNLETNFITWAQAQPNIRAAIVVGSRARVEPPPDEWSDLDLIVYATAPHRYAQESAWLETFGPVWLAHHNTTFAGDAEWMVLYAGGLKVDFVLAQAANSLQTAINQSPYHIVLRRGVRLLFDKDSPKTELHLPLPTAPAPPSEADYLALISAALLTATRTARLLQRGELWQAKAACDTALKGHLLTLLEWQATIKSNTPPDVWYDGRFISHWADPQALADLPATFARYEQADLWRALFATLTLFERLALEVGVALGYAYPAEMVAHRWWRG